MTARTLLEGHPVSYLIHGQPFSLEIEAKGCLFIVIRYDSGKSASRRWAIKRRNTLFRSVTNAYHPVIRAWGVGWGIQKLFEKRLNINFINVLNQDPLLKTPEPSPIRMPVFAPLVLKTERPMVHIPMLKPFFLFPIATKTNVKPWKIDRLDDWESFREKESKSA
jgi:hypothetical protein